MNNRIDKFTNQKNTTMILYKDSLKCLFINLESLHTLKEIYIINKNSVLGNQIKEIIQHLKKKTIFEIKEHNDNYEDTLTFDFIDQIIRNVGMKKSQALTIINQIEFICDKNNKRLPINEIAFLKSIKEKNATRLTNKQTDWLVNIYGRIIE